MRKVVSIALIFLFIVSMIIPTFADAPYVNCSVSNGNKVTVTWNLNQSRTVKIVRDGVDFKSFTNTQNGSFEIEETVAGVHTYFAGAYNNGNNDFKSDTATATGTGKPSIRLEFINKHGTSTSVERIYNWVKIYNIGSAPLDLSKLKIRYFYTVDGEPSASRNDPNNGQQKVEISDARINPNYSFNENNQIKDVSVSNSVQMTFTKMPTPVLKADYYCDTYFQNPQSPIYSAYSLTLQPAFNKKNLTNDEQNGGSGFIKNYNPQSDYSFDPTANDWKENKNICVYYDDQLIWGIDPSATLSLNAPTNLVATVSNFKDVTLNWTASQGAQSYKVYRSVSSSGSYSQIANGITGTTYVDNPALPTTENANIKYYYKVVAVNNTIVSGDSNVVDVTVVKLKAPTNLAATLSNFKDVTLNWTASQGAQSYKVYRSVSSSGSYSQIASGVTGINYVDSTVSSPTENLGKKYYYKVVAVNNAIVSWDSNIATATIYPYVNTSLGVLSCYINNKKAKTDFLLGSSVPIVFELKLNNTTTNPTINLDSIIEGTLPDKLKAALITNNIQNGTKFLRAWKGSSDLGSIIEVNINSITIKGNFIKDDVLRIEFQVKVSPTQYVIKANVKNYYNKQYKINFKITGQRSAVVVTSGIIPLAIKILKPNKLN